MDINGVYASVNFPSGVTGFGGTLFSEAKDPELGIAAMRAWNDWLFEEWYRRIPIASCRWASPTSPIPRPGADEIRRNAARGFTAVTFPEQPHRLGYPARCSIRTGSRSSAPVPRRRPC